MVLPELAAIASHIWTFLKWFFHPSPVDYVVVVLVLLLTLSGHILELLQMFQNKYLEFRRSRVEFKKELAKLRDEENNVSLKTSGSPI